MIFALLLNGQYQLFFLLIITLILSLSFHEYGHGITAKFFGDNTAEQHGRLTINPIAHIDPVGLLLVLLIGIGYAKPVPVDSRNLTHPKAELFIAAVGPFMNLLLAVVMINLYVYGFLHQWSGFNSQFAQDFFVIFTQVNLILMVFNLLPIGPLDGHYVVQHLLPEKLGASYQYYNQRYGFQALLALILLNFLGVPLLTGLLTFARETVMPWIIWFD